MATTARGSGVTAAAYGVCSALSVLLSGRAAHSGGGARGRGGRRRAAGRAAVGAAAATDLSSLRQRPCRRPGRCCRGPGTSRSTRPTGWRWAPGWCRRAPATGRSTVLVANGNAGDRSVRAPLAAALADRGLGRAALRLPRLRRQPRQPVRAGAGARRACRPPVPRRRGGRAGPDRSSTARASAPPSSPSWPSSTRPPRSCCAPRSSTSPPSGSGTTRTSRSGRSCGTASRRPSTSRGWSPRSR